MATVAFGIPVMAMYCYLSNRYPELTLVGLVKKNLREVGRQRRLRRLCFSFPDTFIAYTVVFTGISGRIMIETPTYFISMVFVAAVAVACCTASRRSPRSTEFFVLIVTVLLVFFIRPAF